MPPSVQWTADGLLLALLIVAAVWDLGFGRIPNWLTLGATAAGLVFWTLVGLLCDLGWAKGLGQSAAGLGLAFVPMFLVWLIGGINGGDVKAAGAAGAWLASARIVIFMLLYAWVVAGILAAIVMIRRRVVRRTLGRIWRFLWMAASGGKPGSPSDSTSPRLAWCTALLVATAWVIAERRLDVYFLDKLIGR
ncbi:MAG: hypothetical protein BIFFINMI_02440 [Phycisphaerae bacterium]|nr:hypothetical protein [Phycisphaerae bacterium]